MKGTNGVNGMPGPQGPLGPKVRFFFTPLQPFFFSHKHKDNHNFMQALLLHIGGSGCSRSWGEKGDWWIPWLEGELSVEKMVIIKVDAVVFMRYSCIQVSLLGKCWY